MTRALRVMCLLGGVLTLAACGPSEESAPAPITPPDAASTPEATAPGATAPDAPAGAAASASEPAAAAEIPGLPTALNDLGCFACHGMNEVRIGPPYRAIAARYREDAQAAERLTAKVISGGGGAWGPVPMISHPKLTPEQVRPLIDAILAIQ